jgi:hypothetical protein
VVVVAAHRLRVNIHRHANNLAQKTTLILSAIMSRKRLNN